MFTPLPCEGKVTSLFTIENMSDGDGSSFWRSGKNGAGSAGAWAFRNKHTQPSGKQRTRTSQFNRGSCTCDCAMCCLKSGSKNLRGGGGGSGGLQFWTSRAEHKKTPIQSINVLSLLIMHRLLESIPADLSWRRGYILV